MRGAPKIADAARKMFLKKFPKLLIFEKVANEQAYILKVKNSLRKNFNDKR